jgi:5-(hydroxymethyl)furfural/furfural oxidase
LERQGERLKPVANFQFLAEASDRARLKGAVRLMARLVSTDPLARHLIAPAPSSYGGWAKKLGLKTFRNYALTATASLMLDALPALRKRFAREFVGGGKLIDELIADDAALEAHLVAKSFGQWHPCGTCKMGAANDRDAVISPANARVHGVGGLRVVDASVMPTVPRANLNIPTIMVAEKMADAIKAAR